MIYSNLLIAFAAAAQVTLSYCILQIPINPYVILLEWSSTLLLYNFSLWLSMPKILGESPQPRTKWYFEHKRFTFVLSFFAVCVLFYSLLQLHSYSFYLLCIIGCLSLGYGLPIVYSKDGFITLRQVVGLKVFLIAFVWAFSTVGLPVTEYLATGGSVNLVLTISWAALVGMFILGVTLPFDIRDMKQDSIYHLKTIPLLIGVNKAKKLCYLLIGLHSLCLLVLTTFSIPVKEGLVLVDFFVLFFFYTSLFRQDTHYNDVYILDLVLILQALLVISWGGLR